MNDIFLKDYSEVPMKSIVPLDGTLAQPVPAYTMQAPAGIYIPIVLETMVGLYIMYNIVLYG
jgi:hypothetical protein